MKGKLSKKIAGLKLTLNRFEVSTLSQVLSLIEYSRLERVDAELVANLQYELQKFEAALETEINLEKTINK